MWDQGIESVSIESLVRAAHVVPETKDLGALLGEFRRTNQHMALVLDEYGSFQGIVTLEDVLEEIVGEIEDEYDLPDESVVRIDDHRIQIDGTFPIDDFNEQFGKTVPQEDYHTVAGFVFGQLGRQAETGDEVARGVIDHALRFTVNDTRRAYVWPARHYASDLTDPDLPPMGLRLRLRANFPVASYPPQARAVLVALKRYGMMLADNGSDWFISGAPDPRWNNDQLQTIGRVKGSDFVVVDPKAIRP